MYLILAFPLIDFWLSRSTLDRIHVTSLSIVDRVGPVYYRTLSPSIAPHLPLLFYYGKVIFFLKKK